VATRSRGRTRPAFFLLSKQERGEDAPRFQGGAQRPQSKKHATTGSSRHEIRFTMLLDCPAKVNSGSSPSARRSPNGFHPLREWMVVVQLSRITSRWKNPAMRKII